MEPIHHFIAGSVPVAWLTLALSFYILAKCADLFVDSAVTIARKLNVPQLVIGIVLVSFATTAPELTVSLMSALRGDPEIALGNAIGSVICDDGLALALAGVFTIAPIAVLPVVLKTSGVFLVFIEVVAFLFVFRDYTLSRGEGLILVALFAGYLFMLFRMSKKGMIEEPHAEEQVDGDATVSLPRVLLVFVVAVAGIIFTSDFVITSAVTIATWMHVPKTVIALTMIALGTSIPEVATCIAAARKKAGAIGVGNIIGADIMNICWVAGASAVANNLTLTRKEVYFMFPAMFIIVGSMLLLLRFGYKLDRKRGLVLLGLYVAYLATSFVVFPPH